MHADRLTISLPGDHRESTRSHLHDWRRPGGQAPFRHHHPPRPRRPGGRAGRPGPPKCWKQPPPSSASKPRFASLEQALDKAAFDAVVITTPTSTHTPLAVLAAEPQEARLPGEAHGAQPGRVRRDHRRLPAQRRAPAAWVYAPLRPRVCRRRPAHPGRRDRPPDDDQVADPRARACPRPGRATCAPPTACWPRSTATIGTPCAG